MTACPVHHLLHPCRAQVPDLVVLRGRQYREVEAQQPCLVAALSEGQAACHQEDQEDWEDWDLGDQEAAPMPTYTDRSIIS